MPLGRRFPAPARVSIAAMADDETTDDRPDAAGEEAALDDGAEPTAGDDAKTASGDGAERSEGGLLRAAAVLMAVAVIAALIVFVMNGRKDDKPQSIIPVTPEPKSLAAAGFVEESDGRFEPAGFGMTFDYPSGYFEMISPAGESSRDDETLGIAERRRHYLFDDSAKTASNPSDAQPVFRLIRVKYEESFDGRKLEEFRANLARQPGDKPSEIEQIGGVPAFERTYDTPGGSGSTTYFAANGMLYQLISFAEAGDRRAVERDRESILETIEFTG